MGRFIFTLLIILFSCQMSRPENLHFNRGRGYLPFRHATPEGILLHNDHATPLIDTITVAPAKDVAISFRIDNRHAHPSRLYNYLDNDGAKSSRRNPPWGILLTDSNGSDCWITVSCEEKPDPLSSKAVTKVCLNGDSEAENSAKREIDPAKLPFSGESLWRLKFDNGYLLIAAGGKEMNEVMKVPVKLADIYSFGFVASAGGEILVSDLSFVEGNTPSAVPQSLYNLNSLAERVSSSTDPLEGYWEIFDRTLDESLLKLGGNYKLAIAGDGRRYEIIYIGGATVNAPFWKPGMIKGYLTVTPFPGLYNLEWIDAEGKALTHSLTAQSEKGEMLILQFPYHSSTLRLRRVP